MKKQKKKISMNVINPRAAGIDIGSRSHFVAIGQGDKDVREFGVYAEDLIAIKRDAQYLNKAIRSHRAIENDLHWSLAVLFQEDKSLKKKGNSATNFNLISKMALSLIEKEPAPKVSKIGKMKKCTYQDHFRDLVLKL